MTIYLDSDYKCHVENAGAMRAYETDAFNGKCKTYIEGHRLVPAGETWMREDGKIFGRSVTMLSPWRPLDILEAAQRQYELDLLEADEAYREGVNSI